MMKRPFAIAATLVLALGAVASTQEAVKFERKYSEGQTDTYALSTKTTTTTDLSSMGQGEMSVDFDMSQTAAYTYKNIKEDGTADVTFKYSDIKVKLDGPMAEMMGGGADQMPKEMTGKGKIDKFGRFSEMKLDDEKTSAMMAMWGGSSSMDPMTFFVLPKTEVKVGESFSVEVPALPMFVKDKSSVTGKILGSETVMDKEAWKIEFIGKLRMNMDMSEMMKEMGGDAPPMNMTIEGDIKSKTTTYVSKADGKLLMMQSFSTSDGVVKLADMGFEIPVRTETVVDFKMKK